MPTRPPQPGSAHGQTPRAEQPAIRPASPTPPARTWATQSSRTGRFPSTHPAPPIAAGQRSSASVPRGRHRGVHWRESPRAHGPASRRSRPRGRRNGPTVRAAKPDVWRSARRSDSQSAPGPCRVHASGLPGYLPPTGHREPQPRQSPRARRKAPPMRRPRARSSRPSIHQRGIPPRHWSRNHRCDPRSEACARSTRDPAHKAPSPCSGPTTRLRRQFPERPESAPRELANDPSKARAALDAALRKDRS